MYPPKKDFIAHCVKTIHGIENQEFAIDKLRELGYNGVMANDEKRLKQYYELARAVSGGKATQGKLLPMPAQTGTDGLTSG